MILLLCGRGICRAIVLLPHAAPVQASSFKYIYLGYFPLYRGNVNVLIRDRTVKTVVQRSFRFRTSNAVPLCPVKSTFTNRILPREYAERRPHSELLACAMNQMVSASAFRPTGLLSSLTVHCSPYPNRRYTVPLKESRSKRLI
jgi:hypothetical protein